MSPSRHRQCKQIRYHKRRGGSPNFFQGPDALSPNGNIYNNYTQSGTSGIGGPLTVSFSESNKKNSLYKRGAPHALGGLYNTNTLVSWRISSLDKKRDCARDYLKRRESPLLWKMGGIMDGCGGRFEGMH